MNSIGRKIGAIFGSKGAAKTSLYGLQLVANSLIAYLFLRVISFLWGTGEDASVFQIAWSLPFLLITASGLDSIQAVVTSFFMRARQEGAVNASEVFSSFLNIFLLLLAVLLVIVIFNRHEVAALMAPGLDESARAHIATLLLTMAPVALFLGTGIFMGGIYAAYEMPIAGETTLLATRLAAVITVFSLLAADYVVTPDALAIILLFFAILFSLLNLLAAGRFIGIRYQFTIAKAPLIAREAGVQSAIYLSATLLGHLSMIYLRSLLTIQGVGYVAAFAYAFVISNTIATVLGKLSYFRSASIFQKLYSDGKHKQFLGFTWKFGALLFAASALIGLLFSWQGMLVIRLLFSGGAFDDQSVALVAPMFKILLFSMPALVLLWFLKVPSIIGRYRLSAPLLEVLVWGGLMTFLYASRTGLDTTVLITAFVGSLWLRAALLLAVVHLQVAGQE